MADGPGPGVRLTPSWPARWSAVARLDRQSLLKIESPGSGGAVTATVAVRLTPPVAEVSSMRRKNVTREALRRAALRSAKASAELERRGVPAGYVRSEKVERFLAARRQSA